MKIILFIYFRYIQHKFKISFQISKHDKISYYSLRPALEVPVESDTCFKKVFKCVINKCCSGCWDPLFIECNK